MNGSKEKESTTFISKRSTVGVIRWDAQATNLVAPVGMNDLAFVMSQEARYLSYPQFFHRLPFYAEVSDYGMELYRQWKAEGSTITAPNPSVLPWSQYSQTAEAKYDPYLKQHGGTQEVIDREIAYAVEAGIDYWAFVYYRNWEPDRSGCLHMAAQRNLYLSSQNKRGLRWCPILYASANFTIEDENWIVEQMKSEDFMTVHGVRPLVYISLHNYTTRPKTIKMVESIRNKANAIGKNPYFCSTDWNWEWNPEELALQCLADFKADAISWYATTGSMVNAEGDKKVGKYATLHNEQKANWNDPFRNQKNDPLLVAGKNIQVIPNVTIGIDTRPRARQDLVPMLGTPPYWGNLEPDATGSEIENAVYHALKFNFDNWSDETPNSILLYGWNEFSEAGLSVCPHFDPENPGKPNTMVLDAIHAAIEKAENDFNWSSKTISTRHTVYAQSMAEDKIAADQDHPTPIEPQTIAPKATIHSEAIQPISGPIILRILFDQPVKNFTLDGMNVTNGSLRDIHGCGKTYTVILDPPFVTDETILVHVKQDAAFNASGHGNTISNDFSIRCQKPKLTLTFDTNGGYADKDNIPPMPKIDKGNQVFIDFIPAPPNENLLFSGWTHKGVEFKSNIPITDNITLTATWKEKTP